MKKAVSFIVSFIMIVSCILPLGVFADTAAEDAALVFDMDLSSYGSDRKVGNSVEGNESTVTITSSTQSPILGVTQNGIKYLTFRKTGVQTNSTAIKVQDDNIAKSKELTIEAWIRLDGDRGTSDRARLFGLGRTANNTTSHFADFYFVDNNNVYYDVDSQSNAEAKNRWARTIRTADNYDNKWTHFVVTRKLTEAADETSGDACAVTVYINGVQQGKGASYNVDMSACDSDDKFLVIGAHAGGTGTLWGDVGMFKVYDGIMTADTVSANYEAVYEDFYPPVVNEELIFDMDLSSYSEINKTVVDGASGDTSVITVSGAPVLGTEGSQKYLTFRTSADDKTNAVIVSNPALQNLNNATYEAWVRGTAFESGSANAGRLFALANSDNSPRYIDIYNYGGGLWYRVNGSEAAADTYKKTGMSAYDEKWTHIVFTRQWVEDSAGDTGTWYANMYINGVKQLKTDWTISGVARSDESDAYLVIGNHYGTFSQGFWGDIADFKVYNYILDSESVTQNYDEGLLLFDDGEVDIEFTSASGTDIEYLDGLDEVKILYSQVSNPCWLFAAFYDNSGRVLDVKKYAISEDGNVTVDVAYGADKLGVFVLDSTTLSPLKAVTEIGHSEKYRTYVLAEGGFYDETGNPINSIKDKNNIIAKVKCVSLAPARQVYAGITLKRSLENIYTSETPLSFACGTAEANVALQNVEVQEGDIVTLRVYDSDKEYYTKKIGYEDLSKIVDVLLVAGQSNALGQGGNAQESIKTEPDTVYYEKMGDNTLATTGNQGWASSLGKTWHDETGHTVLIVKAAWGATGFPSLVDGVKLNSDEYGYWNPGNSGSTTGALPRDCYTIAKAEYNAAIASIDTTEYTIGDCVYFWNQGENENRQYTAAQYETAFMELHNKLTTEFGTENTRLKFGGILPVRATTSDGVPANLKLTGPRIAHYKMARENEDLCIVFDATEHWYSDASIKEWFENESGYLYSDLPDSWNDVMNSDNLHYTQRAMNEMGREAALSMLAYMSGGNDVSGIDVITSKGIKHYNDGETVYLTDETVIVRLPARSGRKIASVKFDGMGAEINSEGLLVAKPSLLNAETVMTVNVEGQQKELSFKVYSPIEDETITVATVKDNRAAIYTLTTDDGYRETNLYLDTKLRELGLVATMGLVPSNIDGEEAKIAQDAAAARKYLTWTEAERIVNCQDSVWGVANHTQNHKQGYFSTLTDEQLEVEIDGGRDTLRAHFPDENVLALFTPGGASGDNVIKKAKENHLMLRIVSGKEHILPLAEEDLFKMGGYLVGDTTTAATMNNLVNGAISKGGWVIPLLHGIGDKDAASSSGSGGLNMSTTEADFHLAYVAEKKNSGELWVTTLDEAAIYATQRINSKIKLITNEEGCMIFTLEDNKSKYQNELTVNITLPEGSTVTKVTCKGQPVAYKTIEGGISINILPNQGNIEILYY